MSIDVYRRDLKLATRNIIRQRQRSLFALTIIVGGVIALLLAGGFIQWIFDNIREKTIYAQLGHVQIVRPGYFEQGVADPYSYLLPQNDPLFGKIAEMPGVREIGRAHV